MVRPTQPTYKSTPAPVHPDRAVSSSLLNMVLVCLYCSRLNLVQFQSTVPVCMYSSSLRFQFACIGSGLHVLVLVCMYRFWSAFIGSGLHVLVLVCMYRFWSACIGSPLHVSVLLCMYQYMQSFFTSTFLFLFYCC